ncbi:MAG: hypothetical protein QW324_08725 [Thermofilaceae archaeon]
MEVVVRRGGDGRLVVATAAGSFTVEQVYIDGDECTAAGTGWVIIVDAVKVEVYGEDAYIETLAHRLDGIVDWLEAMVKYG